jgi:hypothetical protein
MVSTRSLIFRVSIPCDKTFPWVQRYVTLTLVFDLLIKTLILAVFWFVDNSALIFHTSVPYDKTLRLSMGTKTFTLWRWPWCLTHRHLFLSISFDTCILKINFNLGYFVRMVGTRDFTSVFLVTRPFEWYVLGYWYFTWVFGVTRPFHGYQVTKMVDLVTFTVVFDGLKEKFNLGYIFWKVCTRTFIFHTSVSWDKIIPWVPTNLTLWPWPLCLTCILKTLTLAITFE